MSSALQTCCQPQVQRLADPSMLPVPTHRRPTIYGSICGNFRSGEEGVARWHVLWWSGQTDAQGSFLRVSLTKGLGDVLLMRGQMGTSEVTQHLPDKFSHWWRGRVA